MESLHHCSLCGGDLVWMGNLGNRMHFRCRNCGIDSSSEVTPIDEEAQYAK
jgi:hypothetical protein